MKVIKAKLIENINELPLPARDLLDMKNYNLMQDGKRTATLITSRGCTGVCAYCSRKSLGNKFRANTPRKVIQEIKRLMEYGYESFYFLDDMFTYDNERAEEIADLIIKEGLNITFRITTRADTVDYDLLKKLKSAGLVMLSIGIEHADNEVLKKSLKNMTIEQNEQVIDWCNELCIEVKGFFILNLPGATEKTICKTLDFAKRKGLKYADFYMLTAFPGSSLWNFPDKFGMRLLDDNFHFFQAWMGKYPQINIDSKELPKEKIIKLWGEVMQEWNKKK